jgi:hypothetical protein
LLWCRACGVFVTSSHMMSFIRNWTSLAWRYVLVKYNSSSRKRCHPS